MIATDSEHRIAMAQYRTAMVLARRRREDRIRDRELQRSLGRLEFPRGYDYCRICLEYPCRCGRGGGGHQRCPVCQCSPCICGNDSSRGKVSRGAEIKRLASRDSHQSLISTQIQNLIRGSNVDLGQNGGKTGPQ